MSLCFHQYSPYAERYQEEKEKTKGTEKEQRGSKGKGQGVGRGRGMGMASLASVPTNACGVGTMLSGTGFPVMPIIE